MGMERLCKLSRAMNLEEVVTIAIVTMSSLGRRQGCHATAESCPCIPSGSLTPPRECAAGRPADVPGSLNYKGRSLWPNLFSPLILPTAMREEFLTGRAVLLQ